jgi:hypothetical protein
MALPIPAPGVSLPAAAWLIATVVAPAPLAAQEPGPPRGLPAPETWHFSSSPAADLWFHGLAMLGLTGDGALALYDSAYVTRARAARQRAGVQATELDSIGPEFSAQVREDPDLQLVHFLPLYLGGLDPERFLAVVESASRQRFNDSVMQGRDARMGVQMIVGSLRRGDARKALQTYAAALESEWRAYYGDWWTADSAARVARTDSIQSLWGAEFSDALDQYFGRTRLDGGNVLLSPALGGEGRLFNPDPGRARDNVVAVRLPAAGEDRRGAAYAVVKELCYDFMDAVPLGDSVAGVSADVRSARAAVRCGSLLLEFAAPQHVSGYRRWFLRAAGQDAGAVTAAAFEEAYPVSRATLDGIREALRRR